MILKFIIQYKFFKIIIIRSCDNCDKSGQHVSLLKKKKKQVWGTRQFVELKKKDC